MPLGTEQQGERREGIGAGVIAGIGILAAAGIGLALALSSAGKPTPKQKVDTDISTILANWFYDPTNNRYRYVWEGTLRDVFGSPLSGKTIELYVLPGGSPVKIGETTTGTDGHFLVDGFYVSLENFKVLFPGDADYNSSEVSTTTTTTEIQSIF